MLTVNISLSTFFFLTILTAVLLYILYRSYHWLKYVLEMYAIFIVIIVGVNKAGFVDKMLKLFEHYHPIGKFWNGTTYVIVSKPETVELLLKKHLSKGQVYEDYFKSLIGKSIMTAPADVWKINRKLVNQTFNQTILNSYFDSFTKHSQKLLKNLQSCQCIEVDIFLEFTKCIFGILCETMMGVDASDVDPQNECMALVSSAQKLLAERVYSNFFQIDLFWKLFGRAKVEQQLTTKLLGYADGIVEHFEKKKKKFNDKHFLSFLMQSHDEKGTWSHEELLHEVLDVIIANDVPAHTISFVMLMVAIHQEVQEKIYQELYELFGNSEREVTLADLDKMNYLDRVIKETSRLFPVGPIILRKVQEDVKLGDYNIANGDNLLVPIISIHRNPIYWPDPLKFDPDRFLPEEVEKRPRFAFMPFSVPPRNCLGMKFAEMFMKVILSTVLRHFKVSTEYDSIASIKLSMHIFLTASDGYGVTLIPRIK